MKVESPAVGMAHDSFFCCCFGPLLAMQLLEYVTMPDETLTLTTVGNSAPAQVLLYLAMYRGLQDGQRVHNVASTQHCRKSREPGPCS